MALPQPGFICNACARSLRAATRVPRSRWASTATTVPSMSSIRSREAPSATSVSSEDEASLPRWKRTPARMKMPLRVRPMPNQAPWSVNEDQEALDKVMDLFLDNGQGERGKGRNVLPEEIKWLAVTHKSFEQGARGFNDRLALLGKRIVDVQISKALVKAPVGGRVPDPTAQIDNEDIIGPTQTHADLAGVENISDFKKQRILDSRRIATLAERYGIDRITRWIPRFTEDLDRSGRDTVLAATVYAIIGAVAMQRGGEEANTLAKEKVLRPLGLR